VEVKASQELTTALRAAQCGNPAEKDLNDIISYVDRPARTTDVYRTMGDYVHRKPCFFPILAEQKQCALAI